MSPLMSKNHRIRVARYIGYLKQDFDQFNLMNMFIFQYIL